MSAPPTAFYCQCAEVADWFVLIDATADVSLELGRRAACGEHLAEHLARDLDALGLEPTEYTVEVRRVRLGNAPGGRTKVTATCPDCAHPLIDHLSGFGEGVAAGCHHRLDRLTEDQSVDRTDYDGEKWCPCERAPVTVADLLAAQERVDDVLVAIHKSEASYSDFRSLMAKLLELYERATPEQQSAFKAAKAASATSTLILQEHER